MQPQIAYKVFGALSLLFLGQLYLLWVKLEGFDEKRIGLEAEIELLSQKRDDLDQKIWEDERNEHRLKLRIEQLEQQMRDRLLLLKSPSTLPMIYFVTPTAFRAEQKADLVRLSQTLAHVPNLFWVVVEDAVQPSRSVGHIIKRSRLQYAHIAIQTPPKMKLKPSDPNWKLPRGVEQRNVALEWIRVGYWPIGIVGGLIVEKATLHRNGTIDKFNAVWKPTRPFPIDMAAFAVNISLIMQHPEAMFTYDVPRGYQESHFLQALGQETAVELEPLADGLEKVLVWHTRTEKTRMEKEVAQRFAARQFEEIEREALGVD